MYKLVSSPLLGTINWFPGHMARATKKIQETLTKVNTVIEVRDARVCIPLPWHHLPLPLPSLLLARS
jgi:ribosome biogenesis GTPase A